MRIKDLSKKQLLGALGYWNNSPKTRKHFGRFDLMLEACEVGEGQHEHSPIVIKRGDAYDVVDHGCYHLYGSEETEVLEALARAEESKSIVTTAVKLIDIDSYNPRRYSAYYAALVSRDDLSYDFSCATYSDDEALYVARPEKGACYLTGQKDYRGKGSWKSFFYFDGKLFIEIEKKDIIKIYKGEYTPATEQKE